MTTVAEPLPLWAFHLPGKHDQKSHGKGGASFGERAAKARAGQDAQIAGPLNHDTADDMLGGEGSIGGVPKATVRADIETYGGMDHLDINHQLRAGRGKNPPAVTRGLDAALSQSKLTDDVVLHRGVRNLSRMIPGAGDQNLTGTTFRDHAYMSTTVTGSAFRGFTAEGGARMRILAPKGTRAMSGPGLDDDEMLLARGLTLRVAADHGVSDGVRNLDVEVVG